MAKSCKIIQPSCNCTKKRPGVASPPPPSRFVMPEHHSADPDGRRGSTTAPNDSTKHRGGLKADEQHVVDHSEP